MFLQQRLEQFGVVIAGVVQYHHHFLFARPVAKQLLQKRFEGNGIELGRDGVNELAAL